MGHVRKLRSKHLAESLAMWDLLSAPTVDWQVPVEVEKI